MRMAVAMVAALSAGGAAWAQNAGPAPAIPSFWDPAYRAERPAAGALTGIRFVTTDDFPPFNFTDQTGRLTGFNVDLARAICTELALQCTIQARPWDDLAPAVTESRADAAIAGIAITEAARATLAFSDVYLRSPARFAVRRGLTLDISPAALAGRTVGVVAGTAHEAFLHDFFPGTVAEPFPNAEAARSALRSGAADAVFGDGVQLAFWLQGTTAGGCCVFAGGPYLVPRYFGEGFAVAVRPADQTLRHALNAAIQALQEKGVYAELYLRYFPVSFF